MGACDHGERPRGVIRTPSADRPSVISSSKVGKIHASHPVARRLYRLAWSCARSPTSGPWLAVWNPVICCSRSGAMSPVCRLMACGPQFANHCGVNQPVLGLVDLRHQQKNEQHWVGQQSDQAADCKDDTRPAAQHL